MDILVSLIAGGLFAQAIIHAFQRAPLKAVAGALAAGLLFHLPLVVALILQGILRSMPG